MPSEHWNAPLCLRGRRLLTSNSVLFVLRCSTSTVLTWQRLVTVNFNTAVLPASSYKTILIKGTYKTLLEESAEKWLSETAELLPCCRKRHLNSRRSRVLPPEGCSPPWLRSLAPSAAAVLARLQPDVSSPSRARGCMKSALCAAHPPNK